MSYVTKGNRLHYDFMRVDNPKDSRVMHIDNKVVKRLIRDEYIADFTKIALQNGWDIEDAEPLDPQSKTKVWVARRVSGTGTLACRHEYAILFFGSRSGMSGKLSTIQIGNDLEFKVTSKKDKPEILRFLKTPVPETFWQGG